MTIGTRATAPPPWLRAAPPRHRWLRRLLVTVSMLIGAGALSAIVATGHDRPTMAAVAIALVIAVDTWVIRRLRRRVGRGRFTARM